MTDRTLTRRHLNRALLARQLLLERSDLSIAGAVEQVAGLQMQYAPSGYVGLWTRLAGFRRDALTAALDDRTVVQASLMRVTIHVVSAHEFWRYAVGFRKARRALVLRVSGPTVDEATMIESAERMRDALADGPRVASGRVGLQSAAMTSISTSQSLTSVCATMAVVGTKRPLSALTRAALFSATYATSRR
jgi:Winged helix DNA-binding domain